MTTNHNNVDRKITVFFLCSPDLGILDNWLSVIYKMKENYNSARFVMILPKGEVVTRIGYDNVLYKISDKIFDDVLVRSSSGLFLSKKTIMNAKNNGIYLKTIFRALSVYNELGKKIMPIRIFVEFLLKIHRKIDSIRHSGSVINIGEKVHKSDVLLYDVHVEGEEQVEDIFPFFSGCYKFSICHGINSRIKDKFLTRRADSKKLTVFLFSDKLQRKYYRDKFLIPDEKLLTVGVPKHDAIWIDIIKEQSPSLPNNFNDNGTIVLFSRRVSSYFTKDMKREHVRGIKKVIVDELGMNLIIKTHPKEYRDSVFDEVLGVDNYGKKWTYSDLHPFVLGSCKLFSISMSTGIAFDMSRLGVPCIEYFNWDDGVDTGYVDSFGKQVSYRVDLGMAVGVHNEEQLRVIVKEIIENPSKYSTDLIRNYEKYFSINNNISSKISSDIMLNAMR